GRSTDHGVPLLAPPRGESCLGGGRGRGQRRGDQDGDQEGGAGAGAGAGTGHGELSWWGMMATGRRGRQAAGRLAYPVGRRSFRQGLLQALRPSSRGGRPESSAIV